MALVGNILILFEAKQAQKCLLCLKNENCLFFFKELYTNGNIILEWHYFKNQEVPYSKVTSSEKNYRPPGHDKDVQYVISSKTVRLWLFNAVEKY